MFHFDLDEPIDNVTLPKQYKKLIGKIRHSHQQCSAFPLGTSLGDFLSLPIESLQKLPYFGKVNLKLFQEFKTYVTLNDTKKEYEDRPLAKDTDRVDSVELPVEFERLIKRLAYALKKQRNISLGDTFGEIIALKEDDLQSLFYFGEWYLSMFRKLKLRISTKVPLNDIKNSHPNELISDIELRLDRLSRAQQRVIDKYAQNADGGAATSSIETIFNCSEIQLLQYTCLSYDEVSLLLKLKLILQQAVSEITDVRTLIFAPHTSVLTLKNISHLSNSEVDGLLLADLNGFILSLNSREALAFKSKLGIQTKPHSYAKIGAILNTTAKVAKRIVTDLMKRYKTYQRFSENNLRQKFNETTRSSSIMALSQFRAAFFDEACFSQCIAFLCGVAFHEPSNYPEVDTSSVKMWFMKEGAPLTMQSFKELLQREITGKYATDALDDIVQYLHRTGHITIKDAKVFPRKMTKPEAIATTLANYPDGLPWKEAAKLANNSFYSKTKISEHRLDNEAFCSSEHLYLSDMGCYRHTRFINASTPSISEIFIALKKYTNAQNKEQFNLLEAHSHSEELKDINYYILRYLVKRHCEAYGFYFNGLSRADTVSLSSQFENVTQKELIFRAIKDSETPLSASSLRKYVRNKSLDLTRMYLKQMNAEGRIVRVKFGFYTINNN